MKKIIFFNIIFLICINCTCNKIRIEMDKELSKKGIDAWSEANYLDVAYINWATPWSDPNLFIHKVDNIPNDLLGITFWDGEGEKPKDIVIHIRVNNDVIIAHEFGHFLGYKDQYTNKRSIMYPSYDLTNKSLDYFIEFKK